MMFFLREEANACKLWEVLKGWKDAARSGKPLAVEVIPEKSKRSREQEKRHWARMRWISENFAPEGNRYSDAAWHAYFCGEFIGREETPGGGLTYISSTTLDVAGYAELDDQIDAYLAGFGVLVVEPAEPMGRIA